MPYNSSLCIVAVHLNLDWSKLTYAVMKFARLYGVGSFIIIQVMRARLSLTQGSEQTTTTWWFRVKGKASCFQFMFELDTGTLPRSFYPASEKRTHCRTCTCVRLFISVLLASRSRLLQPQRVYAARYSEPVSSWHMGIFGSKCVLGCSLSSRPLFLVLCYRGVG